MNQENQATMSEAPCATVNAAVMTTAGSAVTVLKCGGCGVMYSIPTPAPEQDTARMLAVCPHCQHQQPLAGAVPAAVAPVKRTRVAIIGFADSWPMAPCHHPEWEVWALNQFYDLVGGIKGGKINFTDLAKEKRLRWFEIHDRHDLETDPNVIARHPHHVQRLREIGAMGAPVYMHQAWPDIPNSVEYPLAAMTDRFGGYWTNSISYMIALAIAEGFKEIGLYGVNMAMDCLDPDMRVLAADHRWVRARDLSVGHELLAFDETATPQGFRQYQTTTVERLSTLTRPCHRVQLVDGSALVASIGHQWLTYSRQGPSWQRTDELGSDANLGCITGAEVGKPLECWATAVQESRPIGDQTVIGIRTSTQTLIVEGFASHNSEYGQQRPSCEYFIGFARGAGIKVHIPPQSDLLGCPFLYGYEDAKANKFLAKIEQTLAEHQQRMVNHARVRDENEANYQQFHGAIQQLQVMKRQVNIGR